VACQAQTVAFQERLWYNVRQRWQIVQFARNCRLKLPHGGDKC
jgi:hypothetical protein